MNTLLTNPLFDGIIVLALVSVIQFILIFTMWRKMGRFLVDIDSKSITDSLASVSGDLGDLKAFRTELEDYLSTVEKRVRKGIRSVHTVRFNPWQGSGDGGNQSFATAFMNEEGDGILISSLYSRERVSVFGKPLKKHASEHELSAEEKQAVEEARKGLKQI
ncbi:MAG: hypothetical protein JWO00_37 [Candidatus Parcubacteria bacterium]|nr:hypothetical protein [Candidatus Parcubacteria bacterium]